MLRPNDLIPESSAAAPALLVLDDESAILTAIRRTLRDQPYPIFTTSSAVEALELLEREAIAVVVSDYKMPEMDGVRFLAQVRTRFPDVQRIVLTGQASSEAIQEFINESQVSHFITKPWDNQTLALTVAASFDQYRVQRENEALWLLTEQQNRELKALNKNLEDRIGERTRQLERAKVDWERTFDAIVDPVAIVDAEYRVLRANTAYGLAAGVDIRQVPGTRCFEILVGQDSPCRGCPLQVALAGATAGGADILARDHRTLNVWAYPLDPKNLPPGAAAESVHRGAAVCSYRDVTEERAMSAALALAQKLASLGVFVGGVAHEINNPIGTILACAQLALRKELDPEIVATLRDVETSALRCKRIIHSLLDFVNGSEHLSRSRIDLGGLAREATDAFRKDWYAGDRIVIGCSIEPDLPSVAAEPALIHQLLRSLLLNAVQATPAAGGRIEIRIALRPGGTRVIIEVVDQGAGITSGDLPRIFDPFYTTKADAAGLGLSICHRIAEQHGGSIEVQSKVGEGTTIRVTLPIDVEGQGMTE